MRTSSATAWGSRIPSLASSGWQTHSLCSPRRRNSCKRTVFPTPRRPVRITLLAERPSRRRSIATRMISSSASRPTSAGGGLPAPGFIANFAINEADRYKRPPYRKLPSLYRFQTKLSRLLQVCVRFDGRPARNWGLACPPKTASQPLTRPPINCSATTRPPIRCSWITRSRTYVRIHNSLGQSALVREWDSALKMLRPACSPSTRHALGVDDRDRAGVADPQAVRLRPHDRAGIGEPEFQQPALEERPRLE